MPEATLVIRPGEYGWGSAEPWDVRDGEQEYLVALLPAPDFPGPRHVVCSPLVCVAIGRYAQPGEEPKWGWMAIPPETKAEVGDMLVRMGAEPMRWYYLLVTSRAKRKHEADLLQEEAEQRERSSSD
jgi:hypothetical protein